MERVRYVGQTRQPLCTAHAEGGTVAERDLPSLTKHKQIPSLCFAVQNGGPSLSEGAYPPSIPMLYPRELLEEGGGGYPCPPTLRP